MFKAHKINSIFKIVFDNLTIKNCAKKQGVS